MFCFFPQAYVSAPPYIGVNLSVEGQGIPRKPSITRRPSTSKPANTTRTRDSKAPANETSKTKSNESRESKGESRDSKNTSNHSRSNSNRSNESISNSKNCNELSEEGLHNHPHERNPNPMPKNNVKRAEGSWSLGQLQPLDKSKRYRPRSRNGNLGDIKVQGQGGPPRGAQAMKIPKAILRYSSDSGPPKQQVPISIGPSH